MLPNSSTLSSDRLIVAWPTTSSQAFFCSAMVQRVAVVGAGSSGLACVKVCIDEGLEPVCFEGSDDIGGLWKFKVCGDKARSWSMSNSFLGSNTEKRKWFSLRFSFHLQESTEPDQASIYRSLVTNTSKEIMCFSDFPMPAEFPNYLHNSELLQYFRLYADHFHLHRHIRLQVSFTNIYAARLQHWPGVTFALKKYFRPG